MKTINRIVIISIIFLSFVSKIYAVETVFFGSIDEMYDDNITGTSDDPQADWVTDLMIGLSFLSERKDMEMSLSGSIYQQVYAINNDQNSNYQDLAFLFRKNLTQLFSIRMSDQFEHYPDSKKFSVLLGRDEGNNGYISNIFSTGFSVFVTEKLYLDAEYINTITVNNGDELSDSVLHNPGLSIGYSINSANIVRIGYKFSLMHYDNGEETTGHEGYVEYEKFITRQLRAIMHGGCDYIESETRENLTSRGRFSLIDDLDKRNQIELTFLKERKISSIEDDIFDYWKVEGKLSRQIRRRAAIGLSLFYGIGSYEKSDVKDELGGASLDFSFEINRIINFKSGYIFTRKNISNPDADNSAYYRNQINIGLSALY